MSRLVHCTLFSLVALLGCDDPHGGSSGSGGDGIAVINSDYHSTSVSLLDKNTGAVTNADCINSGTQAPGATLALSGDVGLPSRPQADNLLVAIDRTNAALTWIRPTTCTPLRQLDVSTGFFANPHDVISVSPIKAYVTRYERNETPTSDPSDYDDGDDILIIDPSQPAILGRIALAGYAAAEGVQARPDRGLLIGNKVYLVLTSISADFKTIGTGRLVVIDTETDQVAATIDLPTLKNCGGLSYVSRTEMLAVSCAGDFTAADQAATSGIAYVDVSDSPAAPREQLATMFGGRALAGYSGIAEDGELGFAVTLGDFGGSPTDQFWSYDAAAATATKIVDAGESFTLGTVLTDPSHDRVYLADANEATPRVHVYSYAAGTPTLEASTNVNPSVGLPPREIAWY